MRRSSWMRSTRAAWSPIFLRLRRSPRRDALGKGRPCHCHFPAVHELSLPGTPHPAARRKRPGNADRRDLEKGAETLSASAGLCRCLHGEHIIIEEVRCAGLFFRDQRSGLPFLFLILFTAQTAARYSAVSQSPQSQTGQFSAADCSRIFP